jgi:HEAT repeat protein
MHDTTPRKRRKRRRSERRRVLPTNRLVGMALQEWDTEASWRAIDELRERATPETVALCQKLFRSRNWRKRALAVNVMCQLHVHAKPRPPYAEYAVLQAHTMLLEALRDPAPLVVAAAAFGCGHRRSPEPLDLLLGLVAHPLDEVRDGVTFALCFREDDRAVAALLQLAGDSDEDVRNWATFGLTEMPAWDTPAIRERLWQNTHDASEKVRDEAWLALARRGDAQAQERLALEAEDSSPVT